MNYETALDAMDEQLRRVEKVKKEFSLLARGIARLGCKGNKEDTINLMAWRIEDMKQANEELKRQF